MYILLNIRDGSKVNDVIQLLFKNGYTSMNLGEKMTDLCPQCSSESSSHSAEPSETKTTVPKSSRSSATPSVASETEVPRRSPPVKYATITASPSMYTPPPPRPQRASQVDHNAPSRFIEEILLAPKEEELEESPNAAEQGKMEEEPPRTTTPIEYSGIRRRKGVSGGATGEGYVCHLCRSVISNNGPNLMNQLERHARLHASSKQFSCSLCNASFTRRYLTGQHIEASHKENAHEAMIIDHVRELRHEYEILVGKCFFPGIEMTRAQLQAQVEMAAEPARKMAKKTP